MGAGGMAAFAGREDLAERNYRTRQHKSITIGLIIIRRLNSSWESRPIPHRTYALASAVAMDTHRTHHTLNLPLEPFIQGSMLDYLVSTSSRINVVGI